MNLSEKIPGCRYFTWKDALWLREENRAVSDEELTEEVKASLIRTFQWLDKVREWVGLPIIVTIALRTMSYHLALYKRINEQRKAKGLPELKVPMSSYHLVGRAVDFVVKGMTCDEFKAKVRKEGKLEEWKLRMERNGDGAEWIHLDDKEPGPSGREFNP